MGMVKTIKTLTTINQNDGFDCPGYMWPDPDHSSQFEFCENGAKALADEAMKAKVTQSSLQSMMLKSCQNGLIMN